MFSFERVAFVYKSSESSNPARDAKGVQSLADFGGGGVGGVPGGRNSPSESHGVPWEGQDW